MNFLNVSELRIPEGLVTKIQAGGITLWEKIKDLPYWELDYIESTSAQYIDTGIAGDLDDIETYIKFSYSNYVNYGAFYGNYVSDDHNGTRFILLNDSTSALVCNNVICAANGNTIISKLDKNIIHEFADKKSTYTLDNIEYKKTKFGKGIKNSGNIALFNRSVTNPNTTRNIGCRIYAFRILNRGILLCDLIPCVRKEDNAICMYDLVSKKFFLNIGTGKFIAGTYVLPSDYKECEYLESSGTQWIDTEYALKTDIAKLDIQFMNIANNANKNLCSSSANNAKSFGLYQAANNSMTPYNGKAMDASTIPVTGAIVNVTLETLGINKTSTAVINEKSQSKNQTTSIISNVSLGLFTKNDSTRSYITERMISARIYYCKLLDNNVLVRDLVPCLDNKGVPCMFDKVTNQSFYNKGTGQFTYQLKEV